MELAVTAMIASLILGLLLALVKIKKVPVLKQLVSIYISVIRGTPILVQLYVTYFGIPMLLKYINFKCGTNYNVNGVAPIVYAFVALALNESAFNAEIIRASLESVDKGQVEAASALGMNYFQALIRIILPEATVVALPSLGNAFIGLIKGTSLAFVCSVVEMTAEGKIVRTKYDKYRQINRFLEFIEDVLPHLPKDREITILDFGCGKSYLTFAMYYYLKELKGYDIRIIGLDLKKDVIKNCSRLAVKYGYDKLNFYEGSIEEFEGVTQVDMVVTLHACDTATDYALYKALRWGASVILSVPCCQHELNKQISASEFEPITDYGILKERFCALATDGIRAKILEEQGYDTQILEFIDMEHTPKNLLIRALHRKKPSAKKREKASKEVNAFCEQFGFAPTLWKLLQEEGGVNNE